MHARQIDAALKTIVDKLKQKSASSDSASMRDALLEYADSHNLAAAQLEKLGTTLNVSLALAHAKQASPTGRGDNFDLVDVPALLERFTDTGRSRTKRAASARVDEPPEWLEFGVGHHYAGEPKVSWDKIDQALDASRAGWQKVASGEEPLTRAHLHNAQTDADQLRVIADNFSKAARQDLAAFVDLVDRHPQAYAEIAQDVEAHMTTKAAGILEVFDNVLRARHATPTHVPQDTRDFVSDRHNVVPTFQKAAENMEGYHVCQDLIADFQGIADSMPEKIANTATKATKAKKDKPDTLPEPFEAPYIPHREYEERETPRTQGDGSAASDKPDSIRGVLGLPGAAAGAISSTTSGLGDLARQSVSPDTAKYMADNYGTLFGHSREQGAKRLESSMQRWQQAAVLQRLMMSDEVLRRAKPADVVAAFDTIRKVNPAVARDISTARILLREAVQYQGVPLQAVETLSKLNRPADAQPTKKP